MADDSRKQPVEEDEILNRIIRTLRGPHDGFVRPSQSVITAYLMGMATEEEKETMHAALTKSVVFRREILQMAEDMDTLPAADASVNREENAYAGTISRAEFLKRYEGSTDTARQRESIGAKLRRLGIMKIYVPAAAAVAALLLILIQTGVFETRRAPGLPLAEWNLETEQVEPGLLMASTTRGAIVPGTHEAFATPEEAALAEFRRILEFEGNDLRFRPSERPPAPKQPFLSSELRIVNDSHRLIRSLEFQVPIEQGRPPSSLRIWALALDTMSLYSADVSSGKTTVTWPNDMSRRIAVTITYSRENAYCALAGYGVTR